MKNKKIFCIMIVSVLLFTSITVMAESDEDEEINGLYIKDKGTITTEKVKEREIYFIDGEEGNELMGMKFDRYLPLNLEEEYRKEGLKVEFTGKVCFRMPYSREISAVMPYRMPLFILLVCIYHSALPILIKEIKIIDDPNPEKVELTLEANPIELTQEAFELSPEPIEKLPIKDGKIHAIYKKGTQVTITAQEEINNDDQTYCFDHWSGLPIFTEITNDNSLVVIMNEDKSVVGHYKLEPEPPVYYDLGISVEGEGTTDPQPGTHKYEDGEKAQVYAIAPAMIEIYPIPPHSEFSHWVLNGENVGDENPIIVVMDSDKELVAHFKWVETPEIPPIADFTYEPKKPMVGEEIQFTDKSVDVDGEIVEWTWYFGDMDCNPSMDCISSKEQNPTYTYQVPGIYEVILIVTDDDGLTDEKCKEIIVTEETEDDLVFDILPKQGRMYKSGETIILNAVLVNKGDEVITVSKMSFIANSLDIQIKTPDQKMVYYIGACITTWPEVIELEPGKHIIYEIKLDENFGYIEDDQEVPYDFTTPGLYRYTGTYNSWGPDDGRWIGKLYSREHSFIVGLEPDIE